MPIENFEVSAAIYSKVTENFSTEFAFMHNKENMTTKVMDD